MKKALEVYRWVKHPHWTWRLVLWAFGIAVAVAWWLTGTFYRGVLAVVVAVVGWYAFQLAEWLVRRIRLTVEAGIPLSPVRMVTDLVAERRKFTDAEDRWALAMRAQKVIYDGVSPKLHRMTTTVAGDVRASINLAGIGGNLDAIKRIASDGTLAGIMHCQEVTVRENLSKPGRGQITFHKVPPLSSGIPLTELPVSGPARVTFGTEEDGEAAAIAYGLSVLVVGETGSGKSKCVWNMFADILRDGKPTELSIIDPKRTELAVFKPLVGKRVGNVLIRDYKRTPDEAVALFAKFAAEMKERQDANEARGIRQLVEPTEDNPARYVWADELNELQKAYKTIDAPMVTVLSSGRASLDWVVAAVQVAKVSNLGEARDQFPINASFRTKTRENTKAALALEGDDIPPCHRIPRSSPGVGWYVNEDGEVRKFRTAHVTDKQLDDLAKGKLPAGMVTAEKLKYAGPPCFVYVAPDKKPNRCGYVGIAEGEPHVRPVARRLKQHLRRDRVWCAEHERVENPWRVHIDYRRMTVKKYPSRAAAMIAEKRLIEDLNPHWNIQHNGGNLFSNEAMARRAGWRRRTVDALGEYRQGGRERRVARRAVLAAAHRERVARLREARERFVQTVTENAA
jgi:energy-coupling factor transporter ATP-binding protein EcfA2